MFQTGGREEGVGQKARGKSTEAENPKVGLWRGCGTNQDRLRGFCLSSPIGGYGVHYQTCTTTEWSHDSAFYSRSVSSPFENAMCAQ